MKENKQKRYQKSYSQKSNSLLQDNASLSHQLLPQYWEDPLDKRKREDKDLPHTMKQSNIQSSSSNDPKSYYMHMALTTPKLGKQPNIVFKVEDLYYLCIDHLNHNKIILAL